MGSWRLSVQAHIKWILRLLNKPIFQADLIYINIYLIYININQILFIQGGLIQKFKCEELNSSLDYQLFVWHWQHKRNLFRHLPQNHTERLHSSLSLKRFLISTHA